MTTSERKELIYDLAIKYLSEKKRNNVYGRENSDTYMYAKGQLIGACMAFKLNFEEIDGVLIISTQGRKKYVTKVEL